jgi:hypothetical protein
MEGSEDKRLMAWTAGAVWWERAAANDFKLAAITQGVMNSHVPDII